MRLSFGDKSSFIREHVIVLLLLFNSFSWYVIAQSMVAELSMVVELSMIAEAVFPLSIILSALLGARVFSNARKTDFLCIWSLFGVIASLLPAVPIFNSSAGAIIVAMVLGASLGLGMPALLRYFAGSVPIENRGKIGGITFLMVTASAPLVLTTASISGLFLSAIFLAAWRVWSIPVLLVSAKKMKPEFHHQGTRTFVDVFRDKTFVLYFLSWLMFSLVNGFEAVILSKSSEALPYMNTMNIVEPVIAGFSALFAGILADWTGRKRMIIFGFVSLGAAYAILGILRHHISWYMYFIVDGFALGLLWMMFTIVIWGEIATHSIEKHYAVGEIPYFLVGIVSPLLTEDNFSSVPLETNFSVAAFFLFIAVIFLLYVPETLPEKKIQEHQIQTYTQEAIRLKQKAEQEHYEQ